MSEELWIKTNVMRHYTRGSDQNHSQGKKMQKGKMDVWGGLTNSWEKKRSERQKRKGKIQPSECRVATNSKERICQKEFVSEQYKEIEENNRMGNTRDLLKKIRNIKGTFHAKMGTINDKNGMDLTEAEDTKKSW